MGYRDILQIKYYKRPCLYEVKIFLTSSQEIVR